MTLDRLSPLLQLVVIEADPVLRLGLVTVLGQCSEMQVVAEVETMAAALRVLVEQMRGRAGIDLVLLGLSRDRSLEDCQQLKVQFPNLPILLLGSPQAAVLLSAFQLGVEGYCPQGSSVADLISAIRRVAAGQTVWDLDRLEQATIAVTPAQISVLSVLRQNVRSSGLQQIEAALAQINAALQSPNLSLVDRAFLIGQRRELKAARWFVKTLLPNAKATESSPSLSPLLQPTLTTLLKEPPAIASVEMTARDLQAHLFDGVSAKLQSSLENLTNLPLEVDLFKAERKRELFYGVLRQIEASLDELRFSQVQPSQLPEKQSAILRDLWEAVTKDFLGRYYTLRVRNQDIEVVAALLQEADFVQKQMLDRIPLVLELYNYLLFQTPLTIDHTSYAADQPEALLRATDLLENLTIQLANAVLQPLLNRFSDLEVIKQSFYDRRLLSTREIERFRNNLSWRYRVDRYLAEPKAIFESQYWLFVFTPQGIGRISVYNSRREELEDLSGIQLAVTLALETRDAISPRLRSAIAFLGSGVVYLLTEVIGRGIGLIGRGIAKGIGNAWQDNNRGS